MIINDRKFRLTIDFTVSDKKLSKTSSTQHEGKIILRYLSGRISELLLRFTATMIPEIADFRTGIKYNDCFAIPII